MRDNDTNYYIPHNMFVNDEPRVQQYVSYSLKMSNKLGRYIS